jgi:hypothetical protein
MPDHERDCRPLLLGERQELHRVFAQSVAAERYKAGDPEAVKNREQQERLFGRLFERYPRATPRADQASGRAHNSAYTRQRVFGS